VKIDPQRFLAMFLEEAGEHLETLERGLLDLESAPGERGLLDNIFRAAHSIKGGSGTFGFDDVMRFTHVLESLLDELRNGQQTANSGLVELLLEATDCLRELVDVAPSGGAAPPQMERLLGALESARVAGGAAAAPAAAQPVAAPAADLRRLTLAVRPRPELFRSGMDPLLLLRDLCALGQVQGVRLELEDLPALDALDPTRCHLAWTVELDTSAADAELREVFSFVEDECQLAIAPRAAAGAADDPAADPAAAAAAGSAPQPGAAPTLERRAKPRNDGATIRVPTEKVDALIDLVGELVISQSMIEGAIAALPPESAARLRTALATMVHNTREIQERVMSIRMVPISTVFSRFPRLVRDLAGQLGKEVELELEGQETELDKTVVEGLGDPLMHLVRNALDHGLERPEQRLAAGKPAQGRVRLAARDSGGSVIIELSDDGGGIDVRRIRQKAVAKGLIAADADLTDEQLQLLIFEPGFSTVEQVSDLSGRGVGMDVVRSNVTALNGSITIESTPGQGTTFRIKLPLTLAILDGLLVTCGEQKYVLPTLSVLESLRPKVEELRQVYERGELVLVRGEPLPLLRLHHLLAVDQAVTAPERGLVVLLDTEQGRVGLLVDALLGQSQVVIKNLENNYGRVAGLLGATILGDGEVALILDVQGLLDLARRRPPYQCELEPARSPSSSAPDRETSPR
jgi:two-component system chemotaxis sensor kinase CheA